MRSPSSSLFLAVRHFSPCWTEYSTPPGQMLTQCWSAVQLSVSEKGFKKLVELHKHYKAALLDPDVLTSFQVRCEACTLLQDHSLHEHARGCRTNTTQYSRIPASGLRVRP